MRITPVHILSFLAAAIAASIVFVGVVAHHQAEENAAAFRRAADTDRAFAQAMESYARALEREYGALRTQRPEPRPEPRWAWDWGPPDVLEYRGVSTYMAGSTPGLRFQISIFCAPSDPDGSNTQDDPEGSDDPGVLSVTIMDWDLDLDVDPSYGMVYMGEHEEDRLRIPIHDPRRSGRDNPVAGSQSAEMFPSSTVFFDGPLALEFVEILLASDQSEILMWATNGESMWLHLPGLEGGVASHLPRSLPCLVGVDSYYDPRF